MSHLSHRLLCAVLLPSALFSGMTTQWCAGAGLTPSWHELGPLNMPSYEPSQGRVNTVAFDPGNANRFYVGAASGGVWRTTDGGATYAAMTDQMPVLGVSSIVVDSSNANRIFVATGDADAGDTPSIGVWKSEDGGTTWATTGLVFPSTDGKLIYKLMQHPTLPGTLYAATSAGIYTTTDSGVTWSSAAMASYQFYDIDFKPGTPATMYAGASISGGGVFLRSTNSGATWTVVTTGLPAASTLRRNAIATTAAAPSNVYFMASNTSYSFGGLWRSQDSGATFTQMSSANSYFGTMGWYTCVLSAAPNVADEVYVGGIVTSKSTDGGATWTSIRDDAANAMTCHVDVHAIEWRGTTLYVGTDGGLHRSTNKGVNWVDLSGGLGIAQIYAISQYSGNGNLVYTGQQDNGLNRWNGTGWEHVQVGDWGGSVVHPTQPLTSYGFAQSNLYKTTDGWATMTYLPVTGTETGPFVDTVLSMDPVDPQTLYVGLQNVWKTTDGGTSWNKISTFGAPYVVVSSLAVAASNPAYIYAVTSNGSISVTTNGGSTWTTTASSGLTGLGSRTPLRLAVSPRTTTTAYVTTDSYASGARIYRTTDAGVTWTDFSGSLPSVPVKSAVVADGGSDGVYVGTANGVYYRNSSMSDWVAFKAGLPNVAITDMEIHQGSQKLRVGTYGRGLWESSIVEAPPVVVTGAVIPSIPAAGEPCDSLGNVTTSTSAGYTVVDTGVYDSAPASFHLAHAAYANQSITLTPTYYPSATATVQFRSRLGWATSTQVARLQASTDSGSTWTDLYSQSGTGTSGESTFSTRSVSLAAYANTPIMLRFAYTLSGSYYPQTSSGRGWYVDSVQFSNCLKLSATNPAATTVNGTINPNGFFIYSWFFEYGLTTSYGSSTGPPSPLDDAGTSAIPVSYTISSGLAPLTTYHYRLVAANFDGGTSRGNDMTFTTGPVQASYANWAAAWELTGDNAATSANPTRDGLSNLMKFALGVNPWTASPGSLPLCTVVPGSPNTLKLIYKRPAGSASNSSNITYVIERTTNLANPAWTSSGVVQDSVTNLRNGLETVVAHFAPSGGTAFMRLRITTP